METILIPKSDTLLMDVMVNGSFYRQVKFSVQAGVKYSMTELESFAKYKLPSLLYKEFKLLPTTNRV